MTTEIITGIGASIFTAISSIPQFLKLIKEKKADDISVLMYCVLLTGPGCGFITELAGEFSNYLNSQQGTGAVKNQSIIKKSIIDF